MRTDRVSRTAGVAALLLVALTGLTAGCSSTQPEASGAQDRPATSAPAAATGTPTAKPPKKKTSARPSATSTPSSAPVPTPSPTSLPSSPSATTPGDAPGSTSPNGAEMAPAVEGTVAPTPTGLPGLTPPRPDPPLVTLPLPDDATAQGRLVAGFPSFLRPPPASSVATSSIATESNQDRLQVALGASTASTPDQVLAAYRARLIARGMDEQETPTVAGSLGTSFVRGTSTITVTASREGSRTTYSVYGALLARKA